jgi:hypothetical protein
MEDKKNSMSAIYINLSKQHYIMLLVLLLGIMVLACQQTSDKDKKETNQTTMLEQVKSTTEQTISSSQNGVGKTEYIVLAWNDLGMHCLNPTYDYGVILPPYNTIWAQVLKKGNPPEIITEGINVEYELLNNTYSYGKGQYAQFWDNMEQIFGTTVEKDKGLNLVDPDHHNGLKGQMVMAGDHYQVDGIPITPIDDDLTWNAYQVALITVKDNNGTILVETQTTVPTSDEFNCAKCHGENPFKNVIESHDKNISSVTLMNQIPFLCAKCHGSPALGRMEPGSSGQFLSEAIHKTHANRGAACYDCHPGNKSKCNRSLAHSAEDGNCQTCHGDMHKVANSITSGTRLPWVGEPTCVSCHDGIAEVDTKDTLYRNAKGHGELYCATCHGSPHAMVPTRIVSDNFQAVQYQQKAVSIGSCSACHAKSRGIPQQNDTFAKVHGGGTPKEHTSCHICHTIVSNDTKQWPHQFEWKVQEPAKIESE